MGASGEAAGGVGGRRLDACAARLVAKVRRADRRYRLLPEGGRLAVGVSGGADSLALARLLVAFNRTLRRPLELSAVHVRLDAAGVTAGLAPATRRYLEDLGLEVEEVAPRLERDEAPPFECFACARVRRRTLLEAANARGSSHLALGHHADDVVETWLIALLYTGTPEALAPCRSYFDGAVTVVRPAYELRRQELLRLNRLAGAPEAAPPCPREESSRRARVRAMLSALGPDERLVRRQLFWAAVRAVALEPAVLP